MGRVVSDLESGMIEIKSEELSQLSKPWRMVARDQGSIRAGTSELFTRACRTHSATAVWLDLEKQLLAMSSEIEPVP